MSARPIEEELEELEQRIERLRALYEQYFAGLERLEPLIARKDIERRIWVIRRDQPRNTGLRFKFQMLVQRWITYQQYWGRVTREIENGTYRRDVIRVAQRFGEKAVVTLLGKRHVEKYVKLAAAQQARAQRRAANAEPPDQPAAAAAPVVDESATPRSYERAVAISPMMGLAQRRVLAGAALAQDAVVEAPQVAPPAANNAAAQAMSAKLKVAALAAQLRPSEPRRADPAPHEPLDLDFD